MQFVAPNVTEVENEIACNVALCVSVLNIYYIDDSLLFGCIGSRDLMPHGSMTKNHRQRLEEINSYNKSRMSIDFSSYEHQMHSNL